MVESDYVSLAEIEFPAALLVDRECEAHLADNEPARALRKVLGDPDQGPIAQTGWRIISQKDDAVAFAPPAPSSSRD